MFNRQMIKLIFLLLSASTIFSANILRAEECTATWGLLDIEHVPQEKEVWCWAASSNAVTNFYELADPQSANNPPALYTQCRLYNIGNLNYPNFDCCPLANRSDNRCLQMGWPDDVFDRLIPRVDYKSYTPDGKPLLWNQVKEQTCPSQGRGRPFIYAATPLNGIPHTYTVRGFNEDAAAEQYELYVDSHVSLGPTPSGASVVSYDCYYTGWCDDAEGGVVIYTHDGDFYNIRPIDSSHPAAPTNLIVQ